MRRRTESVAMAKIKLELMVRTSQFRQVTITQRTKYPPVSSHFVTGQIFPPQPARLKVISMCPWKFKVKDVCSRSSPDLSLAVSRSLEWWNACGAWKCEGWERASSRVTNLVAAWTADTRMTGCWRAPFCRQLRGKSKEWTARKLNIFRFDATICSNFSRKCVYLFFGKILLLVEQKYLSINQVADVDASISCGWSAAARWPSHQKWGRSFDQTRTRMSIWWRLVLYIYGDEGWWIDDASSPRRQNVSAQTGRGIWIFQGGRFNQQLNGEYSVSS